MEAAAGALSRAFMAAEVSGPTWALKALNPVFLGQVGRDLIRSGDSMHRIDVDGMGMLRLTPSSQWYFTGRGSRIEDWTSTGHDLRAKRVHHEIHSLCWRRLHSMGLKTGNTVSWRGSDIMGHHDRQGYRLNLRRSLS